MNIRNAKHFISEAFVNIIKNRIMSIASILTITSCLLILTYSYLFTQNINFFLQQLETDLGVVAIIDDELDLNQVDLLLQKISNLENITEIKFVSAEQALESLKNQFESQEIFAGFEQDNPLRRSFEINLTDIQYQKSVVEDLNSLKDFGIVNVRYIQDSILNTILLVNNLVRIFSISVIVILSIISVIIITNSIRLAVNLRKQEIKIMKYIGATDSFIRWPFFIEGILIGLLGSVFSLLITIFSYSKGVDYLEKNVLIFSTIINLVKITKLLPVILITNLIFATIICTIGTVISIKRYLKA